MPNRREKIQKLDLMREAGIPAAQADQYTLNAEGELIAVADTPEGKAADKAQKKNMLVELPNNEIDLLKELVLHQRQQQKFNEKLNNSVIIPELQQLNNRVKSIENWIVFIGIASLIAALFSIL